MKALPKKRVQERLKPMTVCIAAVCGAGHEKGPFIVAAADRMITIGQLQYEPAQTKTVNLATQTIGLFAGDMQLHAAVVPRARAKITEATREGDGHISVAEIAEFYAEEFAYYRRGLAEREVLFPRGLDFDRFLMRQATMAHYQVSELDAQLASYYVDSTAIIAGIDETGGHLYLVGNPGIAACYDTPYFVATGAGEALATTQFMVARFDKTWDFAKTLWLTFSAKARAEVAGGVGRQTDLVIVAPGGQIIPLPDSQKEILYSLFDQVRAEESAASDKAAAEIEGYIRSLSAKDGGKEQTSTNDPTPSTTAENGDTTKGHPDDSAAG